MFRRVAAVVLLAAAAGCGGFDETATTAVGPGTTAAPTGDAAGDDLFPDVVDATVERDGDAWRFDVTLSSPYDTPERYADAWRIVGPDGTVYGVRELLHDHQDEQPFTRSLPGVEIPADVDTVTVEGRDQVNGWGGTTLDVRLP